jgi:hypothetical protein
MQTRVLAEVEDVDVKGLQLRRRAAGVPVAELAQVAFLGSARRSDLDLLDRRRGCDPVAGGVAEQQRGELERMDRLSHRRLRCA